MTDNDSVEIHEKSEYKLIEAAAKRLGYVKPELCVACLHPEHDMCWGGNGPVQNCPCCVATMQRILNVKKGVYDV